MDKPAAVLDASSLIVMAKLHEISTLHAVYGTLGITATVFRESVVAGKARGKDDALVIEAAIRQGQIIPVSLTAQQRQSADSFRADNPALAAGECETLAYAQMENCLLLIEERKARAVARAHTIPYTIIQVVPLEGYIAQKITYAKCIELLDRVAVAMNTDLAILNGLKMAAEAIRGQREGRQDHE